MDFATLTEKLEDFKYEYNYELFERDLDLIWTNCMFYNKSETEYWKAAHRYRKRALPHIISSRGEILRKKLITSSQWHALIRANYLNFGKTQPDENPPTHDASYSVFPDQCSPTDGKVAAVSMGHRLLSSTYPEVFDLLWQNSLILDMGQLDTLEIFNSQILVTKTAARK